MKSICSATFAAALSLAPAMADTVNPPISIRQDSHVCLNARNIIGRTIMDDRTIVFRMTDGSYWRNTLQKPCSGMSIADSFRFVRPDNNYVCSDQQQIAVRGGASFCWLGAFARTTRP